METDDTVGAAVVAVQVEIADFGRFALGSKGDPVLAPFTANSAPDAAVGVPLKFTVTTSEDKVLAAIPNHSVCVVS